MAIDKSVYVYESHVQFTMGIKREAIGDDTEYVITVTVDTTGVTREKMLANNFSGSSMRVRLQTQLRKKTASELEKMQNNGFKTTWDLIYSGDIVRPIDRLLTLTREVFVEEIHNGLGVDIEECHEIYNRKHSLPKGTR